jgi:hypothetical protein
MYVLLGFLYIVVWAVMTIRIDDHTPDGLSQLAVLYHLIHPEGRGTDIANLVANQETIEDCFRRLPSRNAFILCEVYERLLEFLKVSILVHGIDPPISESFVSDLVDYCCINYGLTIRQPYDDITGRIQAETMEHVRQWRPTPEQSDMYDLVKDWTADLTQ